MGGRSALMLRILLISTAASLAGTTSSLHQDADDMAASRFKVDDNRVVQLWVSLGDASFASLHKTLAQHKQNLTDVSPYGMLSLTKTGKLIANATLAARAKALGALGLRVWPLLGGSLDELRSALRRPTMVTESVALAKAHGWAGFNLDYEVHVAPQTNGCLANDTKVYLKWLNDWSTALQAASPRMGLQTDVGGCNDPFKIDYCGLTCSQLRDSKLDRLVTMNTYDDDNKSLALDDAGLCKKGDCSRYQVGLTASRTQTAPQVAALMAEIRRAGVSKLSLWGGPPPQLWWDALGAFLKSAPSFKSDDATRATTDKPLPHIVMVLIDDWGWRDGPSAIRSGNLLLTPTMNTLLSEGIVMDRMYAYRYCSPTRTSLLSGRLPLHVNQLNLANNQRGGGIARNMTTIANKLSSAGYFCAAIGKWHAGMSHPSLVPGRRGFAYSLGYLSGSEDHFRHTVAGTGCAGGKGHLIDMFQTDAPVLDARKRYTGVYNGFLFGRTAVELIRNASATKTPLFLYLAFANCHHPMEAPADFLNMYNQIPDTPPANLRRKTYQAMTTFVDSALANVTQALKEGEMWSNTLLVVAGDNGGPSLTDLDTSNNFPLRGGKYSLFDGGNRVNAFVSGGVVPNAMHGTTSDALAHVADLYATFCHLAGVSAVERPGAVDEKGRLLPPVDSVSLWPLLSGANRSAPRLELPLSLAHGDNVRAMMLRLLPARFASNTAYCLQGCSDTPYKNKRDRSQASLIRGRFKLIVGATCPAHWSGPVSPNTSGIKESPERYDCGTGCLFDIYTDPGEHTRLDGLSTHAEVLRSMQQRVVELNATVYQTAYDDSPMTAEECASPAIQAIERSGVWAPWQIKEVTVIKSDDDMPAQLCTAQTVRHEAYYHFPSTDPPNAPKACAGKGNDGVLEARLASSRTGLGDFKFVGAADERRPDAWLPRGRGTFDTDFWRFHGDFDAGHVFVSHGWLKGFSAKAEKDWDTIVMYHQGSQLTHGGVSAWNTPGFHGNASSPPILTGIEQLLLRRDGWASLRLLTADTHNGSAQTKPVALPNCAHLAIPTLLLNAELGVGTTLVVDVVLGDGVRMAVEWKYTKPLRGGGQVSFRFHLQRGMKLYACQFQCRRPAQTAKFKSDDNFEPVESTPRKTDDDEGEPGAIGDTCGPAGKISYNGICAPDAFPTYQNYSRHILHPTYLSTPPSSINITLGRQLFVDTFLIENMTNAAQTFHSATYHHDNPVVKPDKPWEGTFACGYSGGVFFDDEQQRVALWYKCGTKFTLESDEVLLESQGSVSGVCVAYSKDGIHFEKPVLTDVGRADCKNCNATNMVRQVNFDGNTIWLDKKTSDPSERFLMASVDELQQFSHYTLLSSPDGIHWHIKVNRSGEICDNSRIFYNPFRKNWVFSVKTSIADCCVGTDIGTGVGRARAYWETASTSLFQNTTWKLNGPLYFTQGSPNPHRPPTAEEKKGLYWNSPGETYPWLWADVGDDHDPQVADPRGHYPQLNSVDSVAYESVLVNMYSIMQCLKSTAAGQPSRPSDGACKGPENNERDAVFLGWSRDGFQFSRPPSPRVPFTAENSSSSMNNWNWFAVQPVAGNFIVMEDYLYFYVSGRYFTNGNRSVPNNGTGPGEAFQTCQTGLAILRRDGFASLDAITGSTAQVTTRPLVWTASGKYFFVNFVGRSLRVGVVDARTGRPIEPFTLENSIRLSNDTTRAQMHWKGEGVAGLTNLAGQRVQFVFQWDDGSLYSFWVSASECGESRGHLVGGGPGIGGGVDLKGRCV